MGRLFRVEKTMSIFRKILIASSAFAMLSTNANARECISFNKKTGAINGIQQNFNAFEVLIKQGDLDLGKGKTRSGPAYYRQANPECNDNSTALFMNGSNLYITIKPLEAPVTKVEIDFCDFGGVDNVSVRHKQVDFIGKLIAAHGKNLPSHVGDPVRVEVNNIRSFSWGSLGDVVIPYEDLREVVIGGEELFINRICFEN